MTGSTTMPRSAVREAVRGQSDTVAAPTLAWMNSLPITFEAPRRLAHGRRGHHLRPIRAEDTDLDTTAVMGPPAHLRWPHGELWECPPAAMTDDVGRTDPARHADETTQGESFDSALFDGDETHLLGCVYVDAPERVGVAADTSSQVVVDQAGRAVEPEVDATVNGRVGDHRPCARSCCVRTDRAWPERPA